VEFPLLQDLAQYGLAGIIIFWFMWKDYRGMKRSADKDKNIMVLANEHRDSFNDTLTDLNKTLTELSALIRERIPRQ
jgi:hypothetical protein